MTNSITSTPFRRAIATCLSLGTLMLASGCWIPIADDHYEVQNQGAAVVHAKGHDSILFDADELETDLTPGEELQVTVALDPCPPCGVLEEIACSVTVTGNRIEVTAHAQGVIPAMTWCPAACVELTTTCDLGALEEGSYTLAYAGQ